MKKKSLDESKGTRKIKKIKKKKNLKKKMAKMLNVKTTNLRLNITSLWLLCGRLSPRLQRLLISASLWFWLRGRRLLPSLSLDLAVTHLLAKTILSRRSLGVGVGGREVVQDVGLVLPQHEE